jgi:hypothetical protein
MPARLPDDVVFRVQLRIECGESSTVIYKATKVSMSTIQRMRLNLVTEALETSNIKTVLSILRTIDTEEKR